MLTLRNPAFSRRRAAVATAWRGVGEALTNWRRRVAASGAAELIIMAGLGGYHNTNGDRLSTRPCDRNPIVGAYHRSVHGAARFAEFDGTPQIHFAGKFVHSVIDWWLKTPCALCGQYHGAELSAARSYRGETHPVI